MINCPFLLQPHIVGLYDQNCLINTELRELAALFGDSAGVISVGQGRCEFPKRELWDQERDWAAHKQAKKEVKHDAAPEDTLLGKSNEVKTEALDDAMFLVTVGHPILKALEVVKERAPEAEREQLSSMAERISNLLSRQTKLLKPKSTKPSDDLN